MSNTAATLEVGDIILVGFDAAIVSEQTIGEGERIVVATSLTHVYTMAMLDTDTVTILGSAA